MNMNLQDYFFNSLWVLGIALVWLFVVAVAVAIVDVIRNSKKK